MELVFGRRSRSPLIVAVILFTFLQSALSRHRIRHYKDRFKRQQGAHLYLPESYVTEGGEGQDQGPWLEWSQPSPCSRTCGGGVSSQYRHCQEGYTCQGPDRRHFSCNTQDCPDTGDFRAQQCSEFDEVPFENVKYQWVPYTKGPNSCELNCMPKGQRFYYRHAVQVVDGTRCNDENLDVCVNGQCQPVGCDMMLGSSLKEDECRICGGDGGTCNTISNTLELNDMQVGYNDILLIPSGATNILVEEVQPSNNYLAIRNTSGHYYLNGNWRIDFPRSIDFAGTKFHYDRYPQGFAAPDKIFTLGPIDEPIFIVLLYQDSTVPVQYKYSLPTNVQPGSEFETYAWTFDEYTQCTVTCGGGIQNRNVSCAGRKTLEPVDETLCDASRKPETSRKCNEVACEAQWVPHPWGNCSAPCGEEGGVQTREVSCQQVISNGYPALVVESECHGPKPPLEQKCNQGVTCAKWHLDPWKPCDHLCGDGKQYRQVRCFLKDENDKIQLLEDAQCEAIEPRPTQQQNCFNRPCEGVDWIISEWSGCDSICGLTNETRKVFCATAEGQIYDDNLCEESTKPESVRECDGNQNASCNYLWYASQWSECSAKCGKGIQTRSLFCGLSTAGGVQKVDNDKCDLNRTFETIKNCTGKEECDGEWFSGPWGECSKACGGGEKSKKVVCIKANEVVDVSHCDADKITFSQEECNKQACTEDAVLPVDKDKPLKLSEKTRTTEIETEGPTEVTTSVSQEVSGSTEISPSKISDWTENFEFTTEPQAEESDKNDEEEYEVVPADSCDDGEWVDVGEKEEETEPTEETIETTTEGLETAYSIYDTMMSDGTTVEETPFTGSGDGESSFTSFSSSDVTEEGSGTESSIIITDTNTDISSPGESLVSEASTAAGFDVTTKSEDFSAASSQTLITETFTTGGLAPLGSHECQEVFDECEKLRCNSQVIPYVNENECIACRCAAEITTEGGTVTAELSTEDTSKGTSENVSGSTSESASENTDDGTSESSTFAESSASESSTSESSTSESSTSESSTSESSTTELSSSTEIISTEFTSTATSTVESSSNEGETSITGNTTEETTDISTTEAISSGITVKEEPGNDITPPPRATPDDEITEVSLTSTVGSDLTEPTIGETTEISVESSTGGSTRAEETSESVATAFTTSGSTVEQYFTTEVSASTTESVSELSSESITEFSTESITELSTELSGSTEFDIFSSTTEESESTSWETTHITEIFKKRQRMCKRKKIMQCKKTTYGCCWDNIHAAKGPFNKGCPMPKTCKESIYGCCPDGVSAALGIKNRGCPSSHCKETLFGCCWDKKTPAEGNDGEGCPPKPPPCAASKWGCCKDNVTEAKGPKQKGCEPKQEEETSSKPYLQASSSPFTEECKNTTYGCCPDGSIAQGPQYQGCLALFCGNTTFGCCPDRETPAHGYRGEGCCLTSPFGCCSDDVTPARGPNGDGCECKTSPYGCCPDQSTTAKGYNNEGCGCQYNEHGCCPDDITAATGPNYEGCLCHTFQFGCCPDGVSIAQGPHQQGCDCRVTEFGCCSDDKTPAKGPNEEGCTCDITKYGCCLDGVSKALGEDFNGCEELPVDRQEACSLPKERGSCRNYTVKWFFDMAYGGCSRFWYGGCEGNENRFKTKEECEGVCVKPQGIERCNLPKVNGSCDGYFLQFYYDKQSRQCSQFIYGGCLGNNNKFDKREECTDLCSKDDAADPCEQSKAEGPCRGQHRRYFFDKASGQCQEFTYGGCRGNNNNFLSLEACRQKCATPGKKRDYCTIPKEEGNCTIREAKWYYGPQQQRCLPFYYTGCYGNNNNFDSKDACESNCPKDVAVKTCHLPADIGECGNYVTRWYWDTRYKRCNQFYYGGCGGNGNSFRSEEECRQECAREEKQTEPPPQFYYTDTPQTQRPLPSVQVPEPTSRTPTLDEICSMSPDAGPCNDYSTHYFYDPVNSVCKNFTYGGCGGNYNNFESEKICLQYCGMTRTLPSTISAAVVTQGPPSYDRQCYEDPDPGNCTDQYQAFYYDRNTGDCRGFIFSGCGGNGNRYYSEEDCLRRCGPYRGQDICSLGQEPGPCKDYNVKYYFNRNVGRCEQFVYGGCQGNGNRFSSVEECEHYCGGRQPEEPKPSPTVAEVCQQTADQGSCQELNHRRWYFDNTQGECKVFIYSGCGGNQNNFVSFQSCLDYCKDFLPYTEPPVVEPGIGTRECQDKFEECTTLRCPYGIEAYVDDNDCNGCRCQDPCGNVACPEGTQCGIDLNINKTSIDDVDFVAVCRERTKQGQCPSPVTNPEGRCDRECQTDADCTLQLKCCSTECGTVCIEPQKPPEPFTYGPEAGHTRAPTNDVYYPPTINMEVYEPEVTAMLGDQAILNCAVNGNPNPKISWSKGNLIIDGTQPRYRIRLDQKLQIVTLHKTDAGVYLCTADNSIGNPIRNQIRLEVSDPDSEREVTILNSQDPELLVTNIVTSFNSPATLNCYALGWPLPAVTWWKDDELIPLKNREFEVTKDYSLLVHSVQLRNLGVYTCQAYNGKGKAASWSVTIRAKGPVYSTNPADIKYLQYVVNPAEWITTTVPTTHVYYTPVNRPTPQPFIPPVYATEPSPDLVDNNEIFPIVTNDVGPIPDSVYWVPVRANITTIDQKYPTGSNVQIRCDAYGYPPPQVQWYKDGVPLYSSGRFAISETHTLTITSAEKSDSGRYQCEANNPYSKASTSLDVLIEGMFIDPSCTDNQFFANCKLIVKAEFCNHRYYAKFCCRSCTEAGQLPASRNDRQTALDTNAI